MTKKDPYSASDVVAIILALTLGFTLLITTIMVMIFNRDLGETGARLLTTIGAGLVGALSVYIGRALVRNGQRSARDEE